MFLKKRTIVIAIIALLVLNSTIVFTRDVSAKSLSKEEYFDKYFGLSDEEIEFYLFKVAVENDIPPVIFKAIAHKESNYRQFFDSGKVFRYYGNTGIMQINDVHLSRLDNTRLRYDMVYNMEVGANVLKSNFNSRPQIGDRDPLILENWYFALWGYNGWVPINNPNRSGMNAYQESIFTIIEEKYGQSISRIDTSYLPSTGTPSRDLVIPNPSVYHKWDRDADLEKLEMMKELRELEKLAEEDIYFDNNNFQDISESEYTEYINALNDLEIVNGVCEDNFNPSGYVNKEQFYRVLIDIFFIDKSLEEHFKIFEESVGDNPLSKDWDEVSDWARFYFYMAEKLDLIELGVDQNLMPKELIRGTDLIDFFDQVLYPDNHTALIDESDVQYLNSLDKVRRDEITKYLYILLDHVLLEDIEELLEDNESKTLLDKINELEEELENINSITKINA